MLDSAYDRIVSRIYEAPLYPERWNSILQEVLDLLGAPSGHIHVYDHVAGRSFSPAAVGLDPAYGPIFNERFASAPPPCAEVSAQREVLRHDLRLLSPRNMYEEFFRPQEMHYVLFGHLLETTTESWVLAATRPSNHSSFETDQQTISATLLPHLRRALALERELQGARALSRFQEDVLDQVSSAVLVLDEAGRLLQSNQTAARLLCSSKGLTLTAQGRLGAARPADARRIQESFARAARRKTPEGTTFSLEQPGSGRPLTLRFLPARNAEVGWLGARPAVVVVVSDPAQKLEDPLTSLADLHGLTPAERRVAAELIHGRSPKEISERLSITLLTVRAHLRRIFQRTGTGSQREFVALVLRHLTGAAHERDEEE